MRTITCLSGGAKGADSIWAEEVRKIGGRVIEFRPHHVAEEDLETIDQALQRANDRLGRRWPTSNPFVNGLLRRNWYQLRGSQGVFALSRHEVKPEGVVLGGTGWAVAMAIDEGIPVSVWEEPTNRWVTWDGEGWKDGRLLLPEIFTGIGSRDVDPARAAIAVRLVLNDWK